MCDDVTEDVTEDVIEDDLEVEVKSQAIVPLLVLGGRVYVVYN